MTSAPLIFGGLTGAGDLLARQARVNGRDPGIIFGETRLTWRAVNARATRFVNELQRLGIRRGDRVALYARNSHQWVEALFGLAKIGAISVTINYRLTATEVEYIVRDPDGQASDTLIEPPPTPEENAERAAARLHREKPELFKWIVTREHNHLPHDFEFPHDHEHRDENGQKYKHKH